MGDLYLRERGGVRADDGADDAPVVLHLHLQAEGGRREYV